MARGVVRKLYVSALVLSAAWLVLAFAGAVATLEPKDCRPPPAATVTHVVGPDGETVEIPAEQERSALAQGYRRATFAQAAEFRAADARECERRNARNRQEVLVLALLIGGGPLLLVAVGGAWARWLARSE